MALSPKLNPSFFPPSFLSYLLGTRHVPGVRNTPGNTQGHRWASVGSHQGYPLPHAQPPCPGPLVCVQATLMVELGCPSERCQFTPAHV